MFLRLVKIVFFVAEAQNLVQDLSKCSAYFYARQHVVLNAAVVILSVRPSVRLSQPATDLSAGEIETPGFHRAIA